MFTDKGTLTLGHLGRKVTHDDPDVTFKMTEEKVESAGGWKVTIYWEGPTDKVFEDCFGFSEYPRLKNG